MPVALNYDRVLEDRSLILELIDQDLRPGRLRQLAGVTSYLLGNLARLSTGNLRRYGRVAVNFGTPVSTRKWVAAHGRIMERSREARAPELQALADELMGRVAAIVPVPPVPLVAAALLSFGETLIGHQALLERLGDFRTHLLATGAKLIQPDRSPDDIFDRAWRTLRMRRLVVREGDAYVMLPRHRPLLEYYANSIRHLLPRIEAEPAMHPAREPDPSLPKLKPWRPR